MSLKLHSWLASFASPCLGREPKIKVTTQTLGHSFVEQ